MKKRHLLCGVVALALTVCGSSSSHQKSGEERERTAAADSVASKVQPLTLNGFRTKVMSGSGDSLKFVGSRPCVIDFYATWCGPCKQMSPVFELLASRYDGKVDFYRVDVDQEEELAGRIFGVQSIPMFVYINSRGDVNSSLGAVPQAEMVENIEKYCLR